jgi:hypothetical protein
MNPAWIDKARDSLKDWDAQHKLAIAECERLLARLVKQIEHSRHISGEDRPGRPPLHDDFLGGLGRGNARKLSGGLQASLQGRNG